MPERQPRGEAAGSREAPHLVDLPLGAVRSGLPRAFVREVRAAFPERGVPPLPGARRRRPEWRPITFRVSAVQLLARRVDEPFAVCASAPLGAPTSAR